MPGKCYSVAPNKSINDRLRLDSKSFAFTALYLELYGYKIIIRKERINEN